MIFKGNFFIKNKLIIVIILFTISMAIIFSCETMPKIIKTSNPTDYGYYSEKLFEEELTNYDTSANAIKIFDVGDVIITSSPLRTVLNRRVRILVLKEAGKEYANVVIPYYENQSVPTINIWAQTILPNGKKIRLDIKNVIQGISKDNFKYKSFTIPGVKNHCIIEYKYKKVTYRNVYLLEPWYFQDEIETKLSRYTFKTTGIRFQSYSHLGYNFPIENYEPVRDKNYMYTWEFTDLPSINEEPFMGAIRDNLIRIDIQLKGISKSWKEIIDYLLSIYKNYTEVTSSIIIHSKTITNKAKNDINKIEIIYNYVRDNIILDDYGYFASENIKTPQELMKSKKGNIIEKNLLFLSMLKGIGVEAKPVLIATRDYGKINLQTPNYSSFNHLIIYVPNHNGGIFLDTKNKYCPFGILPPDNNNFYGLIIEKEEENVIKISPKQSTSKIEYNNTDAQIDSDGNLKIETTITLVGIAYMHEKKKLDKSDNKKKYIEDNILGSIENSVLDTFTINNQTDTLEIELKFQINNFANVIGNMMYFPLGIFSKWDENIFKSDERKYPIDFLFQRLNIEETKFIIPKGYKIDSYSKGENSFTDGLNYINRTEIKNDTISYYRNSNITKTNFDVEKYKIIKEHFAKIADIDNQQIVLKKIDKDKK